jgi:3-deoxy-7-phosphoheptulonate synthase
MHRTDDVRIQRLRPLLSPAILLEELPLNAAAASLVAETRRSAEAILRGDDDRLLVVVGPCSIHDVAAAIAYGERLRSAIPRFGEQLLLIMRVYFEKPRTTVGWKGLINDPHLDETYDINTGLRQARTLLSRLAALGVPAGTEYLDTISPQFLADLVSWGAIGARTTESQVHRELASGLSMPVGFKNGTTGNVQIAVDAIRAARHPHCFLSVTKQGLSAIVQTTGNDACHVILRGAESGPNYDAASVQEAVGLLQSAGVRPRLMVDCSHGNSGKDPAQQPVVAAAIGAQIAAGSDAIMGVMLESHLVAGRQDVGPSSAMTFGQSITDACMSWEQTLPVLEGLSDAVRARRLARPNRGARSEATDGGGEQRR